jgi:hypothetical protein
MVRFVLEPAIQNSSRWFDFIVRGIILRHLTANCAVKYCKLDLAVSLAAHSVGW